MATFRHPLNGYTQSVGRSSAFWACLVFGVFYFAYKGVWKHALLSLVAAAFTCGISWIIYPFFAYSCVTQSYLERGWQQVADNETPAGRSNPYMALYLSGAFAGIGLLAAFLVSRAPSRPPVIVVPENRPAEAPLIIEDGERLENKRPADVNEEKAIDPDAAKSVELVKKVGQVLRTAEQALRSVSDEASARSAVVTLIHAQQQIDSVFSESRRQSDAVRSKVKGFAVVEADRLRKAITRAYSVPEAKEIIAPSAISLMGMLEDQAE